jgi:carbamoyltransferase
MNIFSIAVNIHDHNTYDGNFHNQIERHNRKKHNLNYINPHDPELSRTFFLEYFLPNYKNHSKDTVFAFTCSNLGQQFVKDLIEEHILDKDFLQFKPDYLWDNYHTKDYYYIDHHQSHAAYAFLSSGFGESDILAIDGRGWQFCCIFINKHGKIIDLSNNLVIGGLWNRLSQDIGFGYLGAGKVMGLVGYGKFNNDVYKMISQYLQDPNHRLPRNAKEVMCNVSKPDVAFTLQYATIELVKKFVYPLKTSNNLCVAGGVAYNGYLIEELTNYWDNVHVPPAVGDEGQSLGTYMHADYVLNRNIHIPSVYSGKEYNINPDIFVGVTYYQKSFNELYIEIAEEISRGAIVGWFQGKSESGNRALGNRSILADPRNPNIKNIINQRIKKREDFRPFAPSVLEEFYQDYFNTNQLSPYMSRIVSVKSNKIPGVTHIDGTARIQTVNKDINPHYYNLINEFYKITGVPMLLNTSFNCQEPIVETPEHAFNTFLNTELDILIIKDYVVKK